MPTFSSTELNGVICLAITTPDGRNFSGRNKRKISARRDAAPSVVPKLGLCSLSGRKSITLFYCPEERKLDHERESSIKTADHPPSRNLDQIAVLRKLTFEFSPRTSRTWRRLDRESEVARRTRCDPRHSSVDRWTKIRHRIAAT